MFRQFSNKSNLIQFNQHLKSKLSKGANQNSSKSFFGKFSRKNFMKNGGNPFLGLFPVTKAIVIGNVVMYGLSWFFSTRDFTTNFLYNTRSLEKGKIHTPITSHFTKDNTINFAIDTIITAYIGNHIEYNIGSQMMQRMLLFSGLGALAITHLTCRQDEFMHPETVIRFIIYFLTLQNPHLKIFLFPFPFQIKIMYCAGIIAGFDIMQNKLYNFSPLMVCLMMRKSGGN